jgi:hypothetical protein
MIKKGDLVRHVSDASFGLGIVTDVIKDSTMPSIKVAKVYWQKNPLTIVFPANFFTPDGLIVLSEAPSADEHIITNENQTR